jgi:hypothetical protein
LATAHPNVILRSRALARHLEGRPHAPVAILRDAAKRPLLRMKKQKNPGRSAAGSSR